MLGKQSLTLAGPSMIIPQIERDLLKLWRSIKQALPLFFIILVVLSPLLLVMETDSSSSEPTQPLGPTLSVGILNELKSDSLELNPGISGASKIWFEDMESALSSLSSGDIDYAITSDDKGSLKIHLGQEKSIGNALDDELVWLTFAGTQDPIVVEHRATESASRTSSPQIAWAGAVALIVFISIVSSFIVWEERAMGYLEELIASPASHLSIMISKLLAVLIIVGAGILLLAVVALAFTIGITWFGDGDSIAVQHAVSSSGAGGSSFSASTLAYILAVIAGISSVAAILVIIQLTIRDRLVISLVTLAFNVPLFFLPLLIPVGSFENASWAWMIPVINIYGDLSFAMLQGDPSYSFFPTLMVNASTLCVVILVGAFSVGRIKDWPAR